MRTMFGIMFLVYIMSIFIPNETNLYLGSQELENLGNGVYSSEAESGDVISGFTIYDDNKKTLTMHIYSSREFYLDDSAKEELAREVFYAEYFKDFCKNNGVTVVYYKMYLENSDNFYISYKFEI